MTTSGPIGESDTAEFLILHGLVDLIEDTSIVLANEESRNSLKNIYRDSTTKDERNELEKLVKRAENGSQTGDIDLTFVSAIVSSLVQTMANRDVKALLLHDVKTSLSRPEIAIYNFIKTRSPESLTGIDLSSEVSECVRSGATHIMTGEYHSAIKRFDRAIKVSTRKNDGIVTRVLAAWTCHWMEEDNRALDYVREAQELHYDNWSTRLIRYVVEHPTPESFRDGPLKIQGFFRILATTPENGAIVAFKGSPGDNGGVNWKSLDGQMDYLPIDQFEGDTLIRIKLSGEVSNLPSLHGYYLGFGVIDENEGGPQRVLHQPVTGPETSESVETIRFCSE